MRVWKSSWEAVGVPRCWNPDGERLCLGWREPHERAVCEHLGAQAKQRFWKLH